jgi:hypothetical protein
MWEMSALLQSAVAGRLVVLDGIHRLTNDALSVLASLVKDR